MNKLKNSLLVAVLGIGCAFVCTGCLFFVFHIEGYVLLGCSFIYGLVMVTVYNGMSSKGK